MIDRLQRFLFAGLAFLAVVPLYADAGEMTMMGFKPLFNGKDLEGWEGATNTYCVTSDGLLTCRQGSVKGDKKVPNLWTTKDYADFIIRFEVKLPPNANNGLGIRTKPNGWCSREGMEIQLLDDWGDRYNGKHRLSDVHYTGAIYGVVPPKRKPDGTTYLKPTGEWNAVEVTAIGTKITVVLNGEKIVDADVSKFSTDGTVPPDGIKRPGLHNRSGRIHWCGHGEDIFWRNIRIRELPSTPWTGKKVAFLGDSITDPAQTNRQQRIYWQYLAEDLGLEPYVYAVSGYQWDRVYKAAQKMKDEMGGDVDAIVIFAGTNDYMNGIPLGEWYDVTEEEVYLKGQTLKLPRRRLIKDMKTFKGRINTVMDFLKTNIPDQQVIIMTPIHRGLARLGGTNIQPEESFPNALGSYIDEYIAALREAADIWSVPLIDLYRESGLYPLNAAQAKCFRRGGPVSEKNPDPDNLHPNTEGHRRLAKTIAARLMTLPPDFKAP